MGFFCFNCFSAGVSSESPVKLLKKYRYFFSHPIPIESESSEVRPKHLYILKLHMKSVVKNCSFLSE